MKIFKNYSIQIILVDSVQSFDIGVSGLLDHTENGDIWNLFKWDA